MRLMAFSLTTQQVRDQVKDVTRRMGWADLKPGERFVAIEKGQGLKKGEQVVRLKVCECVSNRRESLWRMIRDPDYGASEVRREGFPELSALEFVEHFSKSMRVPRSVKLNRIEFKYVKDLGK